MKTDRNSQKLVWNQDKLAELYNEVAESLPTQYLLPTAYNWLANRIVECVQKQCPIEQRVCSFCNDKFPWPVEYSLPIFCPTCGVRWGTK